jgi:hypothetical protein
MLRRRLRPPRKYQTVSRIQFACAFCRPIDSSTNETRWCIIRSWRLGAAESRKPPYSAFCERREALPSYPFGAKPKEMAARPILAASLWKLKQRTRWPRVGNLRVFTMAYLLCRHEGTETSHRGRRRWRLATAVSGAAEKASRQCQPPKQTLWCRRASAQRRAGERTETFVRSFNPWLTKLATFLSGPHCTRDDH